jgi:hypothetical protein
MRRFHLSSIYVDEEEGWVPVFYPLRGSDPQNPNLISGGWTSVSKGVQFGQVGFLTSILPDLQATSGMILFDDLPLGMQWASVPLPRRTEIRDQVHAFGLTFTVQGQFSILQVLNHIVEQIQPGRSAEMLNVQDLANPNPNPG